MRIPHVLTSAAIGLWLGGCSVNPLTKRPELVITSKAKEVEIGKREAAKVEAGLGLVQNEELSAYVRAIGDRLVTQVPDSGFAFTFDVVSMREPNAFALPGGPVYVSRGLIPLTNSEDELADVLGHEVAHVLLRHSARRVTAAAPLSIVTGIGALAAGIVSPMLGELVLGVGGVTQGLLFARYSRGQEEEADRYGMELAARSGWQPAAMSRFLHTLENEEKLQGAADRRFSFFSSHPQTPERVRKTAARAESIAVVPAPPIAPDRRAFLDRLEGMIVDQDPREGIFIGNRMLHTGMDFALEFPVDWKTINQPQVIAAAAPQGKAMSAVELAGEGNDPMVAARAMAPSLGLADSKLHEIEINGLRAVSANARAPELYVDLTWIAHRGLVFLITGATSPQRESEFRSAFIRIPHSFHTLTASERAAIRVQRLRVREAREGETIAALCARSDCAWTAEQVAVANALRVDQVLAVGALVKIAREEPYEDNEPRPIDSPQRD